MAAHYYHNLNDCFISTNLKVWFTTLEKQEKLRRITNEELIVSGKKHYLLVRDPYYRIESFFKDKFRQSPAKREFDEFYQWQKCQKIFFPYLGIDKVESTINVRNKLLSLEFEDFINLLPKVWNLNAHLFPQHSAHFLAVDGNLVKLSFDKYLKVENYDTREFLDKTLGLNINNSFNSTNNLNLKLNWTEKSLEIVNAIYRIDFVVFDYLARTALL